MMYRSIARVPDNNREKLIDIIKKQKLEAEFVRHTGGVGVDA